MASTMPALALYIHWPFCVSKCPYCDFNSHVRDNVDQVAWRTALLTDMAHEAALTAGRQVGSIFFGGGTPSLMPPDTVAALIKAAERHWGFTEAVEITLEANPNSVEVANFAALADAGVNRVSLGIQALDDTTLQLLGRAHNVHEGERAITTAQEHFDRVSFDLITARPGQSLADWETELTRALGFGTGHLSLYQLTIEPGTRFETLHRKGELILPEEDLAADLFIATRAHMARAGLPAYEVSNHARPGEESRHNLADGRYTDSLGIGPGAHGRRLGQASERHKKPENWMAALAVRGHGIKAERTLTPTGQATEALLMGLRLAEGIDLVALSQRLDLTVGAMVNRRAIDELEGLGFVVMRDDRLQVTEAGMLLLDAILPKVVAG